MVFFLNLFYNLMVNEEYDTVEYLVNFKEGVIGKGGHVMYMILFKKSSI